MIRAIGRFSSALALAIMVAAAHLPARAATLSVSDVGHDSATLTLSGHSGNWFYKSLMPPQVGCARASGNSLRLTGLRTTLYPLFDYLYRAYADGNCTDFLDEVSFTLQSDNNDAPNPGDNDKPNPGDNDEPNPGDNDEPDPTPSPVTPSVNNVASDQITESVTVSLDAAALTATTARLTIANHAGNWWYRLDQKTVCVAAGYGSETRVTGLTPGMEHAFAAYAGPDCAGTALAQTSVSTPALMADTLVSSSALMADTLAGTVAAGSGPPPNILSDLDNDGAFDFLEVQAGTDPLDSRSVDLSDAVIDVLVLSTAAATLSYAGEDELKRLIQQRIDYANAAFAASGVRLRLRAKLGALPQTEESPAALLAGIVEDDSPSLAALRLARARAGADLVVMTGLSVEAGGACGRAWLNGVGNGGDFGAAGLRAAGWSWVGLDCGASWLAHEIGHNLGLAHSRAADGGGTFDFSVGHGVEGVFATIMADPAWYGVTEEMRAPLFSNPNLTCASLACGVAAESADGADAVQTLNITGPQVAAWHLPPWPWPSALPASVGLGPAGEVRARFALGALAGGLYRDELRTGDTFDLVAEVEADSEHLGLSAEIYLLIRDWSGRIAQLGADGEVTTWDRTLEGLVPLRSVKSLAAVERFRLVSGLQVELMPNGAAWELYLAYQAGDELIYSVEPLRLRIVE